MVNISDVNDILHATRTFEIKSKYLKKKFNLSMFPEKLLYDLSNQDDSGKIVYWNKW